MAGRRESNCVGETRATQIPVLEDVGMIAAVIFLTVFLALGVLLILIVHHALVAENASYRAEPEVALAIQEASLQNQLRGGPVTALGGKERGVGY
jgi:hypothetical protein